MPVPPSHRRPLPGRPPAGPDLWAVAAPACTAAGLGSLAGILASLRQINPVVVQRVDVLTLACGLAGAAAGWWLGRGLWRLGRGDPDASGAGLLRRRVILALGLLGLAILLGFGVAAGALPDSRRWDMVAGALLAVAVLSAGGWALWRLSRIFGRPDDPEAGDP